MTGNRRTARAELVERGIKARLYAPRHRQQGKLQFRHWGKEIATRAIKPLEDGWPRG